jgi:hypothetical protein
MWAHLRGARKNDTSKEEEEPDDPNDYDFASANESASASFMLDEEEINEVGGNIAIIMNWLATGLRHHPTVINNIIRHTFMPKSGNKDKVRENYWNVINHIMNETRFDVVKLILDHMIIKKCLVRGSIYFAHYIMSLIKVKTRFNGLCDVKHEIYRPFYNAKAFLSKPLTPYGQDAEVQDVHENVDEHASDDDNANVDNLGHVSVDEGFQQ